MSGPKQERAIRTREVIMRAAAEVFAERGFAGASVSSITKQAGMTLGAMYFHFKSKEALAREIVRDQPGRVRPPKESEGLQHAVDITLSWACQLLDDPVLLAGARLVMDQEAFVDPDGDNSFQQWMQVLADDLRAARDRGELRRHVDPEAVAQLVVDACTGAQMHAQLTSGRRDLPERIADIWRCLLPGLVTPKVAERIELGVERGRAS